MQDYRLNYALAQGDVLRCPEGDYEILQLIGFGGMSLVYAVKLRGTSLTYAVKEYFPREEFPERTGGSVKLTQLQQQMAQEEAHMSQQASRNTRRIAMCRLLEPVQIVTGGEIHNQHGAGMFMLLERLDGSGVRFDRMIQSLTPAQQRFPHIYDTLCLIRQVLLALQRCHENGVWFGDIQPANIFLCDARPHYREMGMGMLLDFSAARRLVNGQVEIDGDFCVTEEYAAPELFEEGAPVGVTADIYAVGALLLRCILTEDEIAARVEGQLLEPRRGKELGCNDRSLNRLSQLLNTALAWNPADRFPDTDAMLRAVGRLMDEVRPAKHTLPQNLSAPEFYLPGSREEQIVEILRLLEQGQSPVILHGIGGIGKTETAIRAGQRLDERKRTYLLHWNESTCRTIGELFDSNDTGLSPEERFDRNLRILREEFSGSVLILDNFYRDDKELRELLAEPHFRRLQALNPSISLILTTRYSHTNPRLEIRSLSEDDLLRLLQVFLGQQRENEDNLRALIRYVEGHTLTLKLMAQTLEAEEGRLNARNLLEILKTHTLEQTRMRPVVTDQNRDHSSMPIYRHLKTLFDHTGLSVSQQQMMSIGCMLPQGGINLELLRSCLTESLDDARWQLQRRGWLQLRGFAVKTHPLIAEVSREIRESEETKDFLMRLHRKADQYGPVSEPRRQIAKTLANAADHLYPVFSIAAATFYDELGDIPSYIRYATKAVEYMEHSGADLHALTVCRCQLAEALRCCFQPREALQTLKKSFSSKRFDPLLSTMMAYCYTDLGEYGNALEYLKQVQTHYRKHPETDTKAKVQLLCGLGVVYAHMNKRKEALQYTKKALDVHSRTLSEDQPDATLALLLVNAGACIRETDPEQAMELYLQAENMMQTLYNGQPHPNLRTVYINMMQTSLKLHHIAQAESYGLKGLEIMEPILGAGHPALYPEYRILQRVLQLLGKPEQLKYAMLAIESGGAEALSLLGPELIRAAQDPAKREEIRAFLQKLCRRGTNTAFWEGLLPR